jgi:hypothetical protein
MSPRRLIALLLLGTLAASRLPAVVVVVPAPVREYLFNGNLNDTHGGPALTGQGGTVGAGSYTFGGQQGLLLADTTLNPANYTIELSFSFQSLSSWRKIIDFQNLGSDQGLYSYNSNLQFYSVATSTSTDFTVNTPVHVVLTRDSSTSLVTGYINGVSVLSFTDSGGSAIFNTTGQPLHLFMDDNATGNRESSAGSVDFIRFFDQPLSSAQVLELFQNGAPAAVPEPSTLALLALGLSVFIFRRRAA